MRNNTQVPSEGTRFEVRYHFFWYTPFGMSLFYEEDIKKRLSFLIKEKVKELGGEIFKLDIEENSVSITLSSSPMNAPHFIQRQIKSYTGSILRKEFPVLRGRYGSTWTRDYLFLTIGSEHIDLEKKHAEFKKFLSFKKGAAGE